MMLLDASERLFIASATMDTEPETNPMTPFAAQSTTLHKMQTMLANVPYAERTAEFSTFS